MTARRILGAASLAALALVSVVPAGASRAPIELRPLRAPVPSWYTPALHTQVMAAGPRGVPLPADARAEIPTSSLAFAGIRPGQLIIIDNKFLCTSNFVFSNGSFPTLTVGLSRPGGDAASPSKRTSKKRDAARSGKTKPGAGGSASSYYIGTAGHCGKTGDPVTMLTLPFGLVRIGTIVKSTDGGIGNDFALIAIDPALNSWVSPSMAHWGGPTGVYTGNAVQPIQHSGWGLGVGAGGTPRAGVGYLFTSSEWRFESAIYKGDSGSGAIIAGGLGAGNITHIAINTRERVPVYMAGTSMPKIMSMVGGLSLATCAPVPWPGPGCPARL